MELAETQLITSLLTDALSGTPTTGPRMTTGTATSPIYAAPAAKSKRRGCRCGACRYCADNTRWDEIFEKKFADPDYYSRQPLRHASPLNGD